MWMLEAGANCRRPAQRPPGGGGGGKPSARPPARRPGRRRRRSPPARRRTRPPAPSGSPVPTPRSACSWGYRVMVGAGLDRRVLLRIAMPRLRVAHVVATFPPYWGGTGNVAFHNALELARRGHRVEVLTASVPLDGYRDPAGLTVHRLPAPLRFGNAPLTPGLVGLLSRFQIVHLHWP